MPGYESDDSAIVNVFEAAQLRAGDL